jgi:hypothetical protein
MATSPVFSDISLQVMITFLFAGFTAFFIYADPWSSSLALQPMLPVYLFLVEPQHYLLLLVDFVLVESPIIPCCS